MSARRQRTSKLFLLFGLLRFESLRFSTLFLPEQTIRNLRRHPYQQSQHKPTHRKPEPAKSVDESSGTNGSRRLQKWQGLSEPKIVTPGKTASDAPVRRDRSPFDGTNLNEWCKRGSLEGWKWHHYRSERKDLGRKNPLAMFSFTSNGPRPAKCTEPVSIAATAASISMGKYEVQILDSFENKTYFDGQAGSIYKQVPPLVNASRKPGEWQTYDIIFRAPKFDAEGNVTQKTAVTILHNGVLVQNHFELEGGTFYNKPPEYNAHPEKLPITLQYHGNPMRFRNIWLRKL